MSWQQRAACAGESTDLFFPMGTSGAAVLQAQDAKSICAVCPVSLTCLQWALSTGIEYGVWGGFTEEERRAWKRKHLRGRAGARSVLLTDLLAGHHATAATTADPVRHAIPTPT